MDINAEINSCRNRLIVIEKFLDGDQVSPDETIGLQEIVRGIREDLENIADECDDGGVS